MKNKPSPKQAVEYFEHVVIPTLDEKPRAQAACLVVLKELKRLRCKDNLKSRELRALRLTRQVLG